MFAQNSLPSALPPSPQLNADATELDHTHTNIQHILRELLQILVWKEWRTVRYETSSPLQPVVLIDLTSMLRPDPRIGAYQWCDAYALSCWSHWTRSYRGWISIRRNSASSLSTVDPPENPLELAKRIAHDDFLRCGIISDEVKQSLT